MKYRYDGKNRERNTIYIDHEIKQLILEKYPGSMSEFLEYSAKKLLNSISEKKRLIKEYYEMIKDLEEEITLEEKQSIQKEIDAKKKGEEETTKKEKEKRSKCLFCSTKLIDENRVYIYGKNLCKACYKGLDSKQLEQLKNK